MSISIPAGRGPGAVVRLMALVFAAVVVLAGCGSGGAEPDTAKVKTGAASGGFPVSIKHGHGTTTIKEKPKRVVAVSWMSLDVVAALGTVPVGVDEQWGGDEQGYTPWFRGTVEKLGGPLPEILNYGDAGEIDFEQILSLEPDLIVGLYSGVTDVQGRLTAVAAEHPESKDKTFAYGLALTPGSTEVGLYLNYDARVRLLTEMGFKNTPSTESIASTAKGTNGYGGISLEKLDTIEADVFVGWANGADEVPYTLKDPLFTRWKPIAGKNHAFVQDATLGMATSGPSVLSVPWALERYVPMLADAVAGKGDRIGADS